MANSKWQDYLGRKAISQGTIGRGSRVSWSFAEDRRGWTKVPRLERSPIQTTPFARILKKLQRLFCEPILRVKDLLELTTRPHPFLLPTRAPVWRHAKSSRWVRISGSLTCRGVLLPTGFKFLPFRFLKESKDSSFASRPRCLMSSKSANSFLLCSVAKCISITLAEVKLWGL